MEGKDLFNMALKIGGMAYNAYKDYNNTGQGGQSQSPPPFPSSGGTTRLQGQLKFCSYPEQYTEKPCRAVDAVTRAGNEALRAYPDLTSEVLSFYENNVKKTFVELKGKVPVEYKGSCYGVNLSMMIPEGFPAQPPFVRIINENPDKYAVDPFYERMKSRTDPNSYLLTNLQTLSNWNGRPQAVTDVIAEALSMMSHTFPFKKKKSPEGQQTFNSGTYPANNAGFKNFPSQGFSQQESWQTNFGGNQGYCPPNQGFGFQQGGFNNDYGSNVNAGFMNPAQAKAKAQLDQYMGQAQSFLHETYRTVDVLSRGHVSIWNSCSQMHLINSVLTEQNKSVKEAAGQLEKLVLKSEQTPEINYKSLVVAQDAFSEQLLELVSEKKAWEEASAWLESAFSSDKLPLDVFLKLSRRIEEERFQSAYLIKKCIKERGR